MKIKIITFVLMPLFLVQCTMWNSFFKKESTYFNAQDKQILESTLNSIDFDYGYDNEIDLDYVFVSSFSKEETSANRGNFEKALKRYDIKTAVMFYEKIYRLKSITVFKMNGYKNSGNWKEFTYIKKYHFPPLEKYTELLEKYILKKNKNYGKQIKTRKKIIDQDVVKLLS